MKDPIIKSIQWMRLFSIDKVFDQFADNKTKTQTHTRNCSGGAKSRRKIYINWKRNVFDHPKFEHNRGADAPKHRNAYLNHEGRCQRSDVLYIKHHQWHHYAEQLQHFCFYSSLFNLIFFFPLDSFFVFYAFGVCVCVIQKHWKA